MTREQKRIEKTILKFTYRMVKKMDLGYKKGFAGWDTIFKKDYLLYKLNEKIAQINDGDKEQYVDAANYLMMLDNLERKPK